MRSQFSHLRPRPWSWSDVAMAGFATALPAALLLLIVLLALAVRPAHAHDSWISRGSYKNAAGEWCCGDYDCKTYTRTSSTPRGWMVEGELVPFDEAMPVAPPDGELVICRRPDGTRRCVFGIKPGL